LIFGLQRVDRLETNEDTTAVITSHESKREQYNGIREKGQTMIYKTLCRKLKIEQCNE
jgi:hypothetical protein